MRTGTKDTGQKSAGRVCFARPLWGLVVAIGVAGACVGCGKSTPPAPPPTPPAPPVAPAPAPAPAPVPLTMSELPPVTIQPGKSATVKVQVNRGSNSGPVDVQVSGAPEGVTIKPMQIPADKSEGQLEVAASEKLGEAEKKAPIKVVVKVGAAQVEKAFELTVPKVALPSFAAPKPVVLQAGASQSVEIAVNRNGFQGPLDLQVDKPPAPVTAKVARLEANQNAAKLELTIAAGTPDGTHQVHVVGNVAGRPVAVDVPVQVDSTPFRVVPQVAIHLKPGEKKRIEVPVVRRSYSGPLQLEPGDLPEGVTIKSVQVSPDQKTVALEIVAAENAQQRVRTGKVTAKGGALSRSESLVVRVRGDDEGFLPREVINDPSMPLLRRGSFGGRLTTKTKQVLLEAYGGTAQSEAAVMRGLRWLAAHQHADGCWPLKAYDKDVEGCNCRDAEVEKAVLEEDAAGAAFGVLPFLGAGVALDRSPEEPAELASYQKCVRMAIGYLVKNQTKSKDPLQDGKLGGHMYAHAAATIALCEAYGLSSDDWKERLKLPAQRAIKYIAQAQHKNGGWRYAPRQEGDMSAVAWQFLAIRSGQLGGLQIGSDPLLRAERFVDSCAAGPEGAEESQYSYLPGEGSKGTRPSLTAAGLLTRQYLGKWKKENPMLAAGCKVIMQTLPPESASSVGAIYYYYYATQVLHHMEGPEFDLWNARMREHLIRTQEKAGHRAGSWSPAGVDWGSAGGRLYATSLALMTLEVYYRHLPMFRTAQKKTSKTAVDDGPDPFGKL